MADLTSTSSVIDALGGTAKVARLTSRTMQAVSNWRERGTFPPETFLVFRGALGPRAPDAPACLWGMLEAPPLPHATPARDGATA